MTEDLIRRATEHLDLSKNHEAGLIPTATSLLIRDLIAEIGAIRTIHMPPDASAALDRRLREARAHGMREAADSIKSMIVAAGEANLHNRRDGLRDALDAILARADEIEDGRA